MDPEIDDLVGIASNPAQEVTECELADFWGVTPRQVRMLLSEAVIVKAGPRSFDLKQCTKAYLRHLIEGAKLRANNDPEIKAEKLRLLREQADKAARQNAVLRADYVSADSVRLTWSDIIRDIRARMLALPSRIQTVLPHLTAHDVKAIDSEVRRALEEAANGHD